MKNCPFCHSSLETVSFVDHELGFCEKNRTHKFVVSYKGSRIYRYSITNHLKYEIIFDLTHQYTTINKDQRKLLEVEYLIPISLEDSSLEDINQIIHKAIKHKSNLYLIENFI